MYVGSPLKAQQAPKRAIRPRRKARILTSPLIKKIPLIQSKSPIKSNLVHNGIEKNKVVIIKKNTKYFICV